MNMKGEIKIGGGGVQMRQIFLIDRKLPAFGNLSI